MEDRPVVPMSKANFDFVPENPCQMKQSDHRVRNMDSSSESGWSHPGAPAMSESSLNEHTTSQSDDDDRCGKQEAAFSPQKLDCSSSLPYIPYAAKDYYGAIITGYSPYAAPYLHESRHQHAMKRARGSGGRFPQHKAAPGEEPAASGIW